MEGPTYDPESLLWGMVGKPHGLGGEMTLRSHNVLPGVNLSVISKVILERTGTREIRRLRGARRSGEGWLIRIEGIDSRDAAASATHALVRIPRSELPTLGPGEFFVEDTLGCEVRNESGAILGIARAIFWNGAHDVMSVTEQKAGEAATERLIPLVPAFLRQVDTVGRFVIVAWDEND
jgi:16S rRNA processing protein RimM